MPTRKAVRAALDGLREEAEAAGGSGPATVVLVDPTPEVPEGSRRRRTAAGPVVEIVAEPGGSIEGGIRLTAPLPAQPGKIIAGVNPIDLV